MTRLLAAGFVVLALVIGVDGFVPGSGSVFLKKSTFGVMGKFSSRPPVTNTQKPRSIGGVLGGVDMKLGALLFSCDGVLADTECDGHRLALNMAFKDMGMDMSCNEEQYEKLLHIRGVERLERFWSEIGWTDMNVDTALKVYEKKTEIFQKLVTDGKVPIRKGIKPLIEEAIKAKIPVAVCSSNNYKTVKGIVNQLGPELSSKIQIFCGDQVKRRKPAPDVYLQAQIKLGLDPEECVVFEDNQIGLEAAKKAGMACIITKSKYTQNDKFPEADIEVDDLESGEITLEKVAGLSFSMQGLNC